MAGLTPGIVDRELAEKAIARLASIIEEYDWNAAGTECWVRYLWLWGVNNGYTVVIGFEGNQLDPEVNPPFVPSLDILRASVGAELNMYIYAAGGDEMSFWLDPENSDTSDDQNKYKILWRKPGN